MVFLSLIKRALNSLKNNGVAGSWRCLKNLVRQYLFRHRYKGDMKYVPADDGFTGYLPFECGYEDNIDFKDKVSDIKPLAFYLPQFHTIPENDEWWGEGFTEWTNTKKALPDFEGHYQPRTPHFDIGYYDLSKAETIKKQAELAKSHGIYGFCFYYYWFSGRRLLKKPAEILLANPDIDINFCFCWANENWTRAWDGQQRDILIEQKYSEDDPDKFIDGLVPYFEDKRYIRIEGKPVIIVYNCRLIPDIKKVFAAWRRRAADIGVGDIVIWVCDTDDSDAKSLGITDIIDGEVEFPPHNCRDERIAVKPLKTPRKAHLYNYRKLVSMQRGRYENINSEKPVYRCVMTAWDNSCRRKEDYTAYYGYSISAFYDWVRLAVNNARENLPEESRFVFVNAWNEWAEGTYLEPDEKYGYANINTFSKALYGIPFYPAATPIFGGAKISKEFKVAVQLHAFYTEGLQEIAECLCTVPVKYDLFVTTDTAEKKLFIEEQLKNCGYANITVELAENRGRDVAPFLTQMSGRFKEYDLLCHIHTKKTAFAEYGDYWRKYLYKNLFGSRENVTGIFSLFEQDEKLGVVFPETYPLINSQTVFGANRRGCEELAKKLGIEKPLPDAAVFPAGNMLWMRPLAVCGMFDTSLFDFPNEAGQVNGTDAHRVERLWVYLAEQNGYGYKKVFNCCDTAPKTEKCGLAVYAHFDKDNILSDDDLKMIKAVKEQVQSLVFISTSALGGLETARLDGIADKIILRENTGYDFTSFKHVICEIGREKIKDIPRIILCNNSITLPYDNINGLFEQMSGCADFWGINEFPECEDGSYLKQKRIKRHIQSYFTVFEKPVVESKVFYDFFENLPKIKDLRDAIAFGESRMTAILGRAGFSDACLVKESGIAPKYMHSWALPYEYPYDMLILGSPFIKKKCREYMDDRQKLLLEDFLEKLNNRLD